MTKQEFGKLAEVLEGEPAKLFLIMNDQWASMTSQLTAGETQSVYSPFAARTRYCLGCLHQDADGQHIAILSVRKKCCSPQEALKQFMEYVAYASKDAERVESIVLPGAQRN